MSTAELDTYLLENWADLDDAGARAGAIETAVLDAIDDAVRNWAAAKGWAGVFSSADLLWLSPPAWTIKGGSRPTADAWFTLNWFDADEECWSLTALMRTGQGSAGFRLRQDRQPQRAWQSVITDPDRLAALPAFTLRQPPVLVLPFALDRGEVIEGAAAEDYAIAVQPVIAALDKLEAAVDIITPWLGERVEKS